MLCLLCTYVFFFFFFKQKTAYEMRISDWSSDVCSSDLSFRRSALEIKTRNATMRAQYQAATSFFRNEGNWYKKIKSIQAPTLVANGDRDPTFPAIDSVVLAHAIPKCRRSEEHTSELQSLMRISSAVSCLKKKQTNYRT